ncbi:MAG TPA: hypothetical protein VFD87_17045 [Phototrophicaceae bacterium]|nr:hypothetical protein [Phototrophicaceae bacterium]
MRVHRVVGVDAPQKDRIGQACDGKAGVGETSHEFEHLTHFEAHIKPSDPFKHRAPEYDATECGSPYRARRTRQAASESKIQFGTVKLLRMTVHGVEFRVGCQDAASQRKATHRPQIVRIKESDELMASNGQAGIAGCRRPLWLLAHDPNRPNDRRGDSDGIICGPIIDDYHVVGAFN